jgi:hypothetical protein
MFTMSIWTTQESCAWTEYDILNFQNFIREAFGLYNCTKIGYKLTNVLKVAENILENMEYMQGMECRILWSRPR